jgi:hypothetical protein
VGLLQEGQVIEEDDRLEVPAVNPGNGRHRPLFPYWRGPAANCSMVAIQSSRLCGAGGASSGYSSPKVRGKTSDYGG